MNPRHPNPSPDAPTAPRIGAEELLEHSSWIRDLAARLVGDRADDLVQDTWIAVLRRPPERGRALRPWLAAVVRNLARSRHRVDGNRRAREADSATRESVPSADELALRAERQRELVDSVLALDDPYRSTLLLRFFEGLEPREIAKRTGVPGATVRTRLHRGIELVRVRLDAQHGGKREEWVRGLLPLAGTEAAAAGVFATLGTGALMMNLTFKVAAIASVTLLAWFGLRLAQPEAFDSLQLTSTNPSTRTVAVERAAGAIATPEQLAVGERASAVAPNAAPATERIFEALLVDADTGEPLPHYEILLCNEPTDPRSIVAYRRDGEELTSDADGRVRSEQRYPAGSLWIVEREHRRTFDLLDELGDGIPAFPPLPPIEHTTGGPAPTVDIPVGPTVSLVVDFPEGLGPSDFIALVGNAGDSSSSSQRTGAVRAGTRPWVRFLPLHRPQDFTRPTIQLSSRDGLWSGTADLSAARGVLPFPVAVELRPTARLVGTVADAAGELPADIEVLVLPGSGALEDIPPEKLWRFVERDQDGHPARFDYRGLQPGTYSVRVRSERFEPIERRVELVAETTRVDLELTPRNLRADLSIEGSVRSVTGRYQKRLRVTAWPLESERLSSRPALADVEWELVDGDWLGRFELADLFDRPYRLQLARLDEHGNMEHMERAVRSGELELRPGGPQPDFEIDDDVESVDLTLRVVDAATGDAIEAFSASLFVEDARHPPVLRQTFDGVCTIEDLSAARRREIWLTSDDYRTLMLPAGSIDLETDGEVTFELERGWGTHVLATDAEYGPLPGASVLVDGMPRGVTDERGALYVECDRPPETVEVRLEGWSVESSSDTDLDTGELGPHGRRSGWSLSFRLRARDE